MHPLPKPLDTHPVFTTAHAHEAGWTVSALKHAVTSGRLRRIRRGVYVPVEDETVPSHTYRQLVRTHDALGAALTVENSVISHRSAALLHELPVLNLDTPCLTVSTAGGRTHAGLHVHRAPMPVDHLVRGDLPLTTVARTITDLGREHGYEEALVAADAALNRGLVSRAEMAKTLERCRRWPGIRAARATVEFMDGRSESPLESRSRIRMNDLGLPAPLLQAVIRDEFGQFVARTDFLFAELGVVGEADGLTKYDDRRVEVHEQRRRQLLENLGFAFVRWQTLDLARFERVAERIWHAGRHRTGRLLGSYEATPQRP